MGEPSTQHERPCIALEKSVDSILASARPLLPAEDTVIDGLTEDGERAFFDALRHR
ncbi:hypothetical protein [Gordonia sp. (in: high G+C Gram-positive bacteria)]|uniref:hypothetical protein n=1 Tax=Gordonia sp. (in: high G+C Gram-positive bacteria) TaxID=84139 RepID=UPI001D8EE586|nr:hypothetical protein [Gordonia sp. (in: high G+C Gram-positive bacteria)]MCB1295663.1 hypothetical protein [Gordonia sp. (in: high G+C Gram-positive bacteria)]HMS75260.1 hypothetical protein [Gordonia sp. (in: high G+C Gram-positive bacteria)]